MPGPAQIIYSRTAQRALVRSNKRALLLDKIAQLAVDPDSLANNVTQLRGTPQFRLRVQDWRVIFTRSGHELVIHDVAPRGSVYED
jgi:mRNA interferase RelE/StbE